MTVTALPRHSAETTPDRPARWLPSRAGILNVWRYYDEVFEFHEGRLLLRGENGTGKSKALELLLPFLFDANLRANRLSTFGTGERTMHWNLMGEGATGTTRVGYVWLEFHLPGDPDRWFCCGARLQASKHTTSVHPDYFTTEQRIGDDLMVVDELGQPLTRTLLEQRIGEHGRVHDNATDYRAAVRKTLFPELSEQRYDALITALLQLRTPKLSQRLDPALLSTLLSRALPPLDQQEIADLAEGFERLDRQRERLAAVEREVEAAKLVASRQKTYAQRVLRASAATLVSATTELDNLTRAARLSAAERDQVTDRKTEAEALVETLTGGVEDTEARIAGLTDSEAYKQGRQLDQLRQRTVAAKSRAEDIRGDAEAKRAQAESDEGVRREAEGLVVRHAEAVRGLAAEAHRAATRASLTSVHAEITAGVDSDPTLARQLLRAAVRARRDQLRAVEQALDKHEQAISRREQAETELDDARTDLSAAQERHTEAVGHHETERNRLMAALHDWAARCRELTFSDPGALLELVDSETALLELIDSVAAQALHDITRDETTAASERAATRLLLDKRFAELNDLVGDVDLPPDAPPARTTDRARMAGAPLWRLVDFADTTADDVRSPIEAALQAAGLLDAWVGPAGSVDGHDIFADPNALGRAPGGSLADVLIAEAHPDVAAATTRRLLDAIAYDDRLPADHPAAIGADGSWRLGNLTGTWHKDQPEYVGAVARQRARERRIAELRDVVGQLEHDIATLDGYLSILDNRRAAIAAERADRPRHDVLTEAASAVVRAESDVRAADNVVRQRLVAVSTREREVAAALSVLSRVGADNGIPTDRTALATLSKAIDGFDQQAELWLDGCRDLMDAEATAVAKTEQARRSTEVFEQREREATAAEGEHRRLAAMLETVESTVSAGYREVLEELSTLRAKLADLKRRNTSAAKDVTALAQRLGELNARCESDAVSRDNAITARDTAAHRFRHLAGGTLSADSGLNDVASFVSTLSGSEGVRATLDAARLVAAAWPTVPHAPNNLGDALHRLSEAVHAGRTVLSARADLDLETDDDVQVFTAVAGGVRVGAAELLTILRTEAEQSRHDITDRERELFDQTLTGDTRRHLAARIRQANELVDGMNTRLERVRTASKVSVRLVWQVAPDLPPGTKAARDLLLKDPVRLSETDRESLHRFFRDRIEQAKADDTATSWEQQLAQVFDYTAWHQFVVKIDRANGDGWQLLTKKLHGALSGGEKAIALHLPLFAAVAAHYQATPQAPRIILLDEVFVGVDTNNRGQVFALLSALDLDLMLTSDHEWCTYRELSGISVHQLITGADGDDAVTTARFVWNGYDLLPDE
jgi:uncharacterized protein (TIGR02680 family)